MIIDVMTLFPEMCEVFLSESIIGRARKKGILTIQCHQIRDFGLGRHKRVDDTPYGGGKGMLMLAEPIYKCFENICNIRKTKPLIIYMSPKGKTFNQKIAKDLSHYENIAVLCGHYEGIDQRIIEEIVDLEISIGDYVLTGGEIPGLVLIDAVSRLVPGVLSDSICFEEESHYKDLLEYPQYTKPNIWRGKSVPAVLLSGHHANIEKWKKEQSLNETIKRRPDIIMNIEKNNFQI